MTPDSTELAADQIRAEHHAPAPMAWVPPQDVLLEFAYVQDWLSEPFHLNPLPFFRTRGHGIFWVVLWVYWSAYGVGLSW